MGRAGIALGVALVCAAAWPSIDRWRAADGALPALAAGDPGVSAARAGGEGVIASLFPPRSRSATLLASWQTVGGCGAGASSGTGGGVKWVGRNVSGGLFHVELQGNYLSTSYGYNYIATTLLTAEVSERWIVGTSVPWLYKKMNDPYGIGVDVANKGLGDVNLLATRKLGAIRDLSLTGMVGLPTGTYDARYKTEMLPQDRQLGLGKLTATLLLDKAFDQVWGMTLLGATAAWRGGRNDLASERVPSAGVYGYATYLIGPFAPSVGATLTGFAGHDQDRGDEMGSALATAAANVSIEWATDWVAVLLGASLPYEYTGITRNANGGAASPFRFGPWVVALGVAFAPF